ncbi:MAG: hypothetical protein PHQ35_02420 [Phycisphaerae bacterium]|nr:hypothetical protein [Phycisphaerae bacterium]MDD5380500.1 hypothetical protein [Phycisphaerae bacterium]
MNRIQKVAWWIVVWISVGVVSAVIALAFMYFKVGMPKSLAGLGFLGIAGLGGLGPLIFGKDKGKVTCDERDKLINSRAAVAGFGAAYLVTGLACMLPFFILGPDTTMRVGWLPMIFGAAGLTSFFVHSVAILIQYGRGNKGEKS